MFGYTRYDCGYCDWRGLVGSKGVRETINAGSGSSETENNTGSETGNDSSEQGDNNGEGTETPGN